MSEIEMMYAIALFFIICLIYDIISKKIYPKLIEYFTKEIERNPKWVTSQLQYYGFEDIDIVLCESKLGRLPRFRTGENKRLELLIDNDTPTYEVETIGRIALAAKIKTEYGLWFPDKPLYWLSVLCYMLDGGDIQMSNRPLENVAKEDK